MNACQLTDRPIARAATCGPFHNSRPPDTNFRDMSIAEPPAASAQVQGVLPETVPWRTENDSRLRRASDGEYRDTGRQIYVHHGDRREI